MATPMRRRGDSRKPIPWRAIALLATGAALASSGIQIPDWVKVVLSSVGS
jgi:hypothetical protein